MRAMWLPGAVCSAALLGGCASNTTATRVDPPGANNTLGEAYRDAGSIAPAASGRSTALGRGESMAPLYSDNTVLVFAPIKYDELREGMNVVYVNSEGRRVVHRLIERSAGGWTVLGLNNHRLDTDLVTPRNLLGVVYATFNTGDEPPTIPASAK